MKKIRILIADDHAIFLDALEAMFRGHPDIEVVGKASHGKTLLSLLKTVPVDVILLDLSMPEMDGVEAAKNILENYPEVSVLILSMHGEPAYVRSLRQLGVHGYLLKEEDKSELEAAIRALAEGREYFSRKVLNIARSTNFANGVNAEIKFTNRESEVLNGLAEGWENAKIANGMKVQMSTVETHLRSIRDKTGLGSARALVKYAIDRGYGNGKKG